MTRPIESLQKIHYENRKEIMHEIDLQQNPWRHNIINSEYSYEEMEELCPKCRENVKNHYEYCVAHRTFYRVKIHD